MNNLKANTMKTQIFLSLILAVAFVARADFLPYTSSPNLTVPDANVVGISDSIVVNNFSYQINYVDVHLNISGGYNGDLYGYLVFDSSEINAANVRIDLLNRTGGGLYQDAGMSIILSASADNSIHSYQSFTPSYNESGQVVGTWRPDGGDLSQNSFTGGSGYGNGTWTLFLADMANNDVLSQSSLVTWGIDLHSLGPVPEPTTWAGIIFATLFGGVRLVRGIRKRKLTVEG
jgi:hypothetical protein